MSAAIVEEPHALDALLALGWEAAGSAAEAPEVLVAPRRPFTMADVRQVEEAKDALKKAQRAALTATARPADPAARSALEQLAYTCPGVCAVRVPMHWRSLLCREVGLERVCTRRRRPKSRRTGGDKARLHTAAIPNERLGV